MPWEQLSVIASVHAHLWQSLITSSKLKPYLLRTHSPSFLLPAPTPTSHFRSVCFATTMCLAVNSPINPSVFHLAWCPLSRFIPVASFICASFLSEAEPDSTAHWYVPRSPPRPLTDTRAAPCLAIVSGVSVSLSMCTCYWQLQLLLPYRRVLILK